LASFYQAVDVICAKDQIWHGLFIVVLCGPSRAQKVCVLFVGVGCFLLIIVEVAVLVAVVAVLFVICVMGRNSDRGGYGPKCSTQ